jgi:hypothetical protein
MRLTQILPAASAMMVLVLTAGCASMRSASVGTDAANYSIDATNQMGHSMTVFWSDGGEEKMLGSVAAGRTERFIIAAPRTTSISVMARDANRTHMAGPWQVTLVANSPQRVTIR